MSKQENNGATSLKIREFKSLYEYEDNEWEKLDDASFYTFLSENEEILHKLSERRFGNEISSDGTNDSSDSNESKASKNFNEPKEQEKIFEIEKDIDKERQKENLSQEKKLLNQKRTSPDTNSQKSNNLRNSNPEGTARHTYCSTDNVMRKIKNYLFYAQRIFLNEFPIRKVPFDLLKKFNLKVLKFQPVIYDFINLLAKKTNMELFDKNLEFIFSQKSREKSTSVNMDQNTNENLIKLVNYLYEHVEQGDIMGISKRNLRILKAKLSITFRDFIKLFNHRELSENALKEILKFNPEDDDKFIQDVKKGLLFKENLIAKLENNEKLGNDQEYLSKIEKYCDPEEYEGYFENQRDRKTKAEVEIIKSKRF